MMTKTISVLALLAGLGFAAPVAATELKVQSFNIWGGGANEGKTVDETVAVLKAVGADIIGIQETRLEADPCTADVCPPVGTSVAKAIADALGYYYVDQTATNDALWSNAILSRFPIGAMTPNGLGVSVEVEGRKVAVFNIHLDDSPYQPYQLLNIEYGDAPFLKTEDEAVAAAIATRGKALDLLEADMKAAGEAELMLVFGDFNEPSGLDWTEAAGGQGHAPDQGGVPDDQADRELGLCRHVPRRVPRSGDQARLSRGRRRPLTTTRRIITTGSTSRLAAPPHSRCLRRGLSGRRRRRPISW